jgi:hypothetical protein
MSFNWFVGTAAICEKLSFIVCQTSSLIVLMVTTDSQVYAGQYYNYSVGTVGFIAGCKWSIASVTSCSQDFSSGPPLIGACIASLASG